jgi:cytochrome c biogenesis protein
MSAAEESLKPKEFSRPRNAPLANRLLDFVSSVRFGVTLLCTLVVLSMIGMLIMQQNVQGFDTYFASLTPAEKTVYGRLGLFDIYHSWYFNLLLLVLSLNIILASIDRFPTAWSYIASPKLTATGGWLRRQTKHAEITLQSDERTAAERIADEMKKFGLKPTITENQQKAYVVDETGEKTFEQTVESRGLVVFGESGRFNRIGAYIVHVALLTLFLGHFVALQTGFDADVRMIPGDRTDQIQLITFDLDKQEKFNVQLPFSMECTDIQQKLIDPNGSIEVTNTLDWRTQMKVTDPEYGETLADISMNQPFTYRGYRFFQAQTIPMGNARVITVEMTPEGGGTPISLELPRNGGVTTDNGIRVEYDEFLPDFTFNAEGKPDTRTGEYNNPAAVLTVTPPGGERQRVFAFAAKLENVPVAAPKAGYKWRLAKFEKSPFAHILSIKYDPFNAAFVAWYFGGFGLIFALGFVFLFSHRRIWALVEPREAGGVNVTFAGDANRNHLPFSDKFDKFVEQFTEK